MYIFFTVNDVLCFNYNSTLLFLFYNFHFITVIIKMQNWMKQISFVREKLKWYYVWSATSVSTNFVYFGVRWVGEKSKFVLAQ